MYFCKLVAITLSIVCLCGCDGVTKKDITIIKKEPIEMNKEIPIEDGGRSEIMDEDAPKEISSEELVLLDCWFYSGEFQDLQAGKYSIKAELKEDGTVSGSYEFCEKDGYFTSVVFPFEADALFMRQCNDIIKESGIVQFNGTYAETHGIPDGCGFSVDAGYASGERISCYDNAGNYFSDETMSAFNKLFYEKSGAKEYYNTDRLQNVHYMIYERDVYSFYADIYEDAEGNIKYIINENTDGKNNWAPVRSGTVSPEILQKIKDVYEKHELKDIPTYPRREDSRYYSLDLMFGENQEYVYSNTAISDEQLEALAEIRELVLGSIGE